MSGPLICPKCEKEIVPGSMVSMITPDDPDEKRVFTDDDLIIVHSRCPQMKPSIRVPCEGSDHPTRDPKMNGGECALCGVIVTCRDDGTAWPHERNDVVSMLAEGLG